MYINKWDVARSVEIVNGTNQVAFRFTDAIISIQSLYFGFTILYHSLQRNPFSSKHSEKKNFFSYHFP
ncbi:hypothetical protein RJT34_17302 [Clitoria ternatea]|uniref:Uncharacterized protein n=1 Tax=Clitoria ternatea TaxID=43366 RepID=A0AAN9J945_CLITE